MTGFNFGAMLSQNNQIKQIPLDMLVPFHNHQFSLYDGERRDDMVESIRKNGVMTPIVCRPNPDGSDTYEILIGHNRWNCSKIAGFETIPAIIKEQLTEDEAQTYVDESNLIQRGFNDLKVSEQARIIARRYSEMFSQGKRNDIINEIKMLNGEETSVNISVDKDGYYYIGQTEVPAEEIVGKLRAIRDTNTELSVTISGDAGAEYGRVIGLMALLKEAGFDKVGLKTEAKPLGKKK